ncbi:MAG TPA: hypothetical protein VGP26_26470 [Actinophytocola sp.]|jgi:hypothetical protein|nr:hypothetical protein [Actinophytocola sp.]
MDGYRVEPGQLRSAASGIGDAIGSADDTNLEQIPGKSAAYGHAKLNAAITQFCTTWELAKQILQQRSADAGEALTDDAGVYERQEAHGAATFDPALPQPMTQPMPAPGPAPGGP